MRLRTLSTLPIIGLLWLWPAFAGAQSLDGHWTLSIRDLQHRERVVAVVHFESKEAQSCLGGDWNTVVVESTVRRDDAFFPIADPLSWELRDGALTIGRNQVCDAYLEMNGPIGEDAVAGSVFHYGKGGRGDFGEFVLQRQAVLTN